VAGTEGRGCRGRRVAGLRRNMIEGHENVQTSLGPYGHLFPDREDELTAGLDRRKAKADQERTKSGEVVDLGA
jgi:hypothetical protein